jgi:enoyl-CoA hydratase/carnithine racemase
VEYEQVTSERRGEQADVLLLTLDRPERLNAWTPRMTAELSHAIEAADEDPEIGAVVVTGAGRGFCAGADIEAVFAAQLQGDQDAGRWEHARDWIELVRSTKPIVAAVNGPVIGVGLSMILPFDRLVAADGARFSMRFVKVGLVPELASSTFLPLRCGWGAASDLMLSGRTIDAHEAHAIGLADEVVPADAVVDVAIERARSYGENPAPALRSIKQLLTQNANETDTRAAQGRELKALGKAYTSTEHQEAVAAFLARRTP